MSRVWPVKLVIIKIRLFPNLVGSNPRTSFLLNKKFKHFFCFSLISGTFGNKRTDSRTASLKEHDFVPDKHARISTEQRVTN